VFVNFLLFDFYIRFDSDYFFWNEIRSDSIRVFIYAAPLIKVKYDFVPTCPESRESERIWNGGIWSIAKQIVHKLTSVFWVLPERGAAAFLLSVLPTVVQSRVDFDLGNINWEDMRFSLARKATGSIRHSFYCIMREISYDSLLIGKTLRYSVMIQLMIRNYWLNPISILIDRDNAFSWM
jgi:hypothetical protein